MPQHIALLTPAIGTGNVGDHFIERAICRLLDGDTVFHRFSVREPLRNADVAAINATDAAVLCGTNLYQYKWSLALTPALLDRIKVPVVPLGVGGSAAGLSDVAISEETREMIVALHAHCEVGSVRDPFTASVLEKVGVRNFQLTGCPVLLWSGGESLPSPASMARDRVILTARNFLMHHAPVNVDNPVQIELMRQLLATFPTTQVRFPVHESFDRNLVKLLHIDPAMVLDGEDVEEYLAIYSQPGYVVLAMRLHAGMLALANGLPVVFVGHDTRTYSFCQMLGLDCVELFTPDCAAKCIDGLRRKMRGDVELPMATRHGFVECRTAMQQFLRANRLAVRSPVA